MMAVGALFGALNTMYNAVAVRTREIATLLELSVNTVAVHRANIMDRLGLHKTAELVLYAVRRGIVS